MARPAIVIALPTDESSPVATELREAGFQVATVTHPDQLEALLSARRDVADFANSVNSPMAGCITAALFLKRFVPDETRWAHLDTYAWRDSAKPGRPKGGDALGLRTIFATLQALYSRD